MKEWANVVHTPWHLSPLVLQRVLRLSLYPTSNFSPGAAVKAFSSILSDQIHYVAN